MFSLRLIVLVALVSTVAAGPWGQICAGNSGNRVRGRDSFGSGAYGASRSGREKHFGVDVICSDGSTVYAPFSGTIERRANPYTKNNAINNGLQLLGEGFCIKMLYIKPIKYSGRINKGEKNWSYAAHAKRVSWYNISCSHPEL